MPTRLIKLSEKEAAYFAAMKEANLFERLDCLWVSGDGTFPIPNIANAIFIKKDDGYVYAQIEVEGSPALTPSSPPDASSVPSRPAEA